MSQEPKKEQLFHRKFIWSQWDTLGQRLYVIFMKKMGRSTEGNVIQCPVLQAFQFSAQAQKMANLMVISYRCIGIHTAVIMNLKKNTN